MPSASLMPTVLGPYTADAINITSGMATVGLLGVYGTMATSGNPVDPVNFIIYDAPTNSGNKLFTYNEPVGQAFDTFFYMFPQRIDATGNLSLDVTASAPGSITVYVLVH